MALAACAVALPFVLNQFWVVIGTRAAIYWVLAAGLNLAVGFGGGYLVGRIPPIVSEPAALVAHAAAAPHEEMDEAHEAICKAWKAVDAALQANETDPVSDAEDFLSVDNRARMENIKEAA